MLSFGAAYFKAGRHAKALEYLNNSLYLSSVKNDKENQKLSYLAIGAMDDEYFNFVRRDADEIKKLSARVGFAPR